MHTPVNYVEALKEHYGSMGFPPYQWTMNESAPLTPLTKPLATCTVALLTSGGTSRRESLPWNPDARNDFRLDAIPSDTSENGFQVFAAAAAGFIRTRPAVSAVARSCGSIWGKKGSR